MILNGQCLRLADNTIKCVDVDIEKVKEACNNPFMAEPLPNQLQNMENILLICSPDISENVYDYIVDLCSGKNISIISQNIPSKFKEYEVVFNNTCVDDYEFFGACAGRAAMLLHNSLKNYDIVITVSSVMMNTFGGFLGSIATLFTNTTANKTISQMIKYALQDSLYSIQKLHSGVTIRNPIYESMREGIITAGKSIHSFAINIVSDYAFEEQISKDVYAGDLFISQIEAQNNISKFYKTLVPAVSYDGITVKMQCYNNVIYFISLVETACRYLLKGGRLLIEIDDMKSFGNKAFQDVFYNNNTLEEMIEYINDDNYMEVFYAFILKYYTSHYHIALPENDKLNGVLKQAGLNPMRKIELNSFLGNCNNTTTI